MTSPSPVSMVLALANPFVEEQPVADLVALAELRRDGVRLLRVEHAVPQPLGKVADLRHGVPPRGAPLKLRCYVPVPPWGRS